MHRASLERITGASENANLTACNLVHFKGTTDVCSMRFITSPDNGVALMSCLSSVGGSLEFMFVVVQYFCALLRSMK